MGHNGHRRARGLRENDCGLQTRSISNVWVEDKVEELSGQAEQEERKIPIANMHNTIPMTVRSSGWQGITLRPKRLRRAKHDEDRVQAHSLHNCTNTRLQAGGGVCLARWSTTKRAYFPTFNLHQCKRPKHFSGISTGPAQSFSKENSRKHPSFCDPSLETSLTKRAMVKSSKCALAREHSEQEQGVDNRRYS
jgi:hypothetical protein